jgi:uncharacterized protein (TIGR04255 family)
MDYKKLNNQPLRFVLAEFRFSTVMDIQSYIPKLQEALRKQYPIPEKKSEQAIYVQPDGIGVSAIDRWSFVSANKKNAVDINQDRLIYCTAEYPRFEGFSSACKHALDTLSNIVEPSLIVRIGLRYGDLVKIEDNEKASDLVNKYLTFPECFNELGNAQRQSSETFIVTEFGGLVIRTLYGLHNLTCLPDIQGLPVTIESDEKPSERIVLDFDHFWESKDDSIAFETGVIINKLESLHETSRKAFWKVTTNYARNEKWV